MRSVTEVHGLRYFFLPEEELLLLVLLLRCDICDARLLLRLMSSKKASASKAGGAFTMGAVSQSEVEMGPANELVGFGMWPPVVALGLLLVLDDDEVLFEASVEEEEPLDAGSGCFRFLLFSSSSEDDESLEDESLSDDEDSSALKYLGCSKVDAQSSGNPTFLKAQVQRWKSGFTSSFS